MISVKQNVDVYEVRFRYDPDVVAKIKQVPGRYWHSEDRYWSIPVDRLGFLINQFKGTKYESEIKIISNEKLNENQTLECTTRIPDIDISNVPFYVKEGCEPFKHQIDFMKYAIDRELKGNLNGFILADDPGLAKTVETFNLAVFNKNRFKYKHCLVICCINSAKYHWQEDIYTHSRGKFYPYILGTRRKRNGQLRYDTGGKEKLEDLQTGHMLSDLTESELPYFILTNIESIRYKIGKRYPIVEELIKLCNAGYINMIAIDEVHKNTSPSSSQGKQILEIKKHTDRNVMWIPITGTPINSKPTDVYLPLRLIEGHNYSSYYSWCKQFCVYGGFSNKDVVAYKNIDRLKYMLESNMIRRLKSDVLKDLPPKIHFTEYVENTPYQKKLYEQIAEDLENRKEDIVCSLDPRSQFLRLRQVNGAPELIDTSLVVDESYIRKNAKISKVLELLENISQRNEKTIIFSNWVDPLRTLYKIISKKYKVCCYTGTMKEEVRQHHKQVFKTNPEYTIIIGTIGALGTMHNLPEASNIIFLDEPWNATDFQQAEDRAHRADSKQRCLNIYSIITKSTVDERVHNIMYTKDGIAKYIVDNIDIRSNPELFDLLLADTLKHK